MRWFERLEPVEQVRICMGFRTSLAEKDEEFRYGFCAAIAFFALTGRGRFLQRDLLGSELGQTQPAVDAR